MNKALLDTDTLSEIGKGKNPAITANAKTYRKVFGYYSYSTLTVLEIVRGYQKAEQLQRLHAFMAYECRVAIGRLQVGPEAELPLSVGQLEP